MTVRPAFQLAVDVAERQIGEYIRITGESGAQAQAKVIAGRVNGPDLLAGSYRLTSGDFRGKRNPPRDYPTLPQALMAFRCLNAGTKSLWHVDPNGKRRLIDEV